MASTMYAQLSITWRINSAPRSRSFRLMAFILSVFLHHIRRAAKIQAASLFPYLRFFCISFPSLVQLLHAQKFYEGLAWVQYEDEADNLVTSVINTDGTICFSLPAGVEPSYMAPFVDGYSFYRVGDSYASSYEVAIDQDGNEYYRTSNSDDAKSWEHIIGQHDSQYICLVEKNGLEDIEFIFTLIQPDGTQISSCSCGSTSPLWTNSIEAFGEVEYYGEGWYSAGEYYFMGTPHITYFNFDKQRVLIGQERAVGVLAGEFVNGEIPSLTTFYNVDGQCILNTDLEVVREYDFGALINYASDTLLYVEDRLSRAKEIVRNLLWRLCSDLH